MTNRDRRRELSFVDTVEQSRELALLSVTSNDVVGFGEWIQCPLVDEDALVGGSVREEIIVLAHGCDSAELRVICS